MFEPVTDPVLIVAIAMAAFLLMPLITDRLRLPDIIGVVLAGVIVGPHGLGFLERDETIHLLGTVGLLYLVFLAGLEVDLGDLSRKRKRAIGFGVITFLVPQVFGTLGALFLFDYNLATAVLLGSVFSSHSFLALLIAKRMNLTERELVISVIGGTVITDTLALFVLAVVAQSALGNFGIIFLLQLLLQTSIFATLVVFGVPLLGSWFFKRVTDGTKHFTFMMTVLFTCGYVAHLAGLEPIIGAFLSGLAMNRLVPHSGALANRAFFFGNSIFVPFFLLSVGMLIDLSMVFGDLRTIEMAVFMTVTVVVCKGIAAWVMRVLYGYSRNDVVVAWGLSLPQAATTLAVVLVGHDLKLFDDAVLNATIVMVFITCFLGPVLVQIAGRRIADAAATHEPTVSEAGLQRMLLPLANPASSHNLLDMAVAMRRPLVDEPIMPMSVARNVAGGAAKEKLLADSVLHLAASDVPVRPVIRVDLNPANGILRA
ncbi:MAG: cation:proton antiporter, partial [Planctomycetes bacterium]|nr:cation:proton antiporter [Planctomycetota bacterium]